MPEFIYDFDQERGASMSKGIRYSSLLCQSTTPVTITLGPVTFAVPTSMAVSIGQRVRASLINTPTDDPTQYVEGPVTAYSSTSLTINVDTISGNAGTQYAFWQLTLATNLTGGSWDAIMRLSPDSCSGRVRTPITLSINVALDPTTGVFTIYLSPTQTAALALGAYSYRVLFTPASSSDKLKVVSGTITVVDA